jgi:hypothetical protein
MRKHQCTLPAERLEAVDPGSYSRFNVKKNDVHTAET